MKPSEMKAILDGGARDFGPAQATMAFGGSNTEEGICCSALPDEVPTFDPPANTGSKAEEHDKKTTFDEPNESCVFDEEDFYEAIDLMETSRKMIGDMLKYGVVYQGRRVIVENHCDDLKQFIDMFIVSGEEEA